MSRTNKEVAIGDTLSSAVPTGDTLYTPDEVAAMWRYIGKTNVQCHIKGSLRALSTLINLCSKEGTHRTFMHSLQSNTFKANRVALVLQIEQLRQVEALMDEAEVAHEEYLRAELLAYANRTKTNPQ